MILSLQYLRALAALLVLGFHLMSIEAKYSQGPLLLSALDFGHVGVDIFFFISGFVMAYITLRGKQPFRVKPFLWKRLLRIYPTYWFYFALVLVLYLVKPGMVNSSSTLPPDLLTSFLLLPAPKGTMPLVAIAWTLTYELYFYLIFALLGLSGRVVPGLVLWAGIVLAGMQLAPGMMVFSYHNLEFIAGALAGAGFLRSPGVQRLEARVPHITVFHAIGNASYSLYLSHILVLSAVGKVWAALGIQGLVAHVAFLVGAVVVAVVYSLLSYRFLEKPVMEWGKRK